MTNLTLPLSFWSLFACQDIASPSPNLSKWTKCWASLELDNRYLFYYFPDMSFVHQTQPEAVEEVDRQFQLLRLVFLDHTRSRSNPSAGVRRFSSKCSLMTLCPPTPPPPPPHACFFSVTFTNETFQVLSDWHRTTSGQNEGFHELPLKFLRLWMWSRHQILSKTRVR